MPAVATVMSRKRLDRCAGRPRAAKLHLDEDEHGFRTTAINGDQVHLPLAAADVTVEHLVFTRLEVIRGESLAGGSEPATWIGH